jgi:hypothetical protein
LRRQAAKLLTTKLLQHPYRELHLTREERGGSITTFIAQRVSVSEERASDIYNEWLAQSLRGEKLSINDVCIIEKGTITTDKLFDNMANPNGRGTTKIRPRVNYFIYIVAGLCIGFALGIAGYVMYSNRMFDSFLSKERVAPASEAFENTTSQIAEIEEVKEGVTPIENTTTTADITEDAQPTENLAEPAAKESTIADLSIVAMNTGHSYAVWGVYNELQNAKDAKAWLAERFPEIEANVYQYDERYMVALCETTSRSECGRKVSAWKAQNKSFQNVWVYTR